MPIGWLNPPTIPSSLVRVLLDADLWHFGILTSAMHMAWLRQIGGRLKSDYRYSIGIVYNTFPWPEATVAARARGFRIECADAWIAATALRHDVPLVTHNRGDCLGVPGLKLISHGQ